MPFIPQNLQARLNQAGQDFNDAADQFGNELSNALRTPLTTSANISLDPLGQALADTAASARGAVQSLDQLGSALSNPGAAIGNAIGGALNDAFSGAVGGFLGNLLGGGSGFPIGPQPNSLSKFASYNNIFTFGAVSKTAFNTPMFTYRTRGPDVTILRSGGTAGDQVRTPLEKSAGITGEYFIDDIDVVCLVAPNSRTQSTNATTITFNVIEPYSMGLFLQALHIAAAQAGYTNYLEAVYLLQIEFIGYDDNGRSFKDSRSTRMFPLKLSNVEFDVTEQGSNYFIEAIPYHETALSDEVQMAPVTTDIQGATIVELLQTGPQSLATILNTREQEQKQAGNKAVADEYVIMFPKDMSSAAGSPLGAATQATSGATTASAAEAGTEGAAGDEERNQELFDQLTGVEGGEVPADFDAEISKVLGIVVRRSQIGESIREAAEKEENINNIGKSKIVKSFLDQGTQYFGRPAFVEDKENAPGVFQRGNIQISDEGRRINFSQGTKIQTMIEEVILLSEYARNFVTEQPDANGMKTWFRIESDVFLVPGNDNVAQTGEGAKVYVYKVIPFKTQVGRFTSPTSAPPGYTNLRRQAIKQYDYIYTGENDDILDFNININAAFFTALNGDFGQLGASQITLGANGLVINPESPIHGASAGNNTNSSSSGIGSTRSTPTTNTGEAGSGPQNHPENAIARTFNDAIVNSETDLVGIDFEIWGDPYYIVDSGMGNYNASPTGSFNINSDGSMDYQNGEVDIIINFRTPVDIRDPGYMKFPAGGTKAVGAFSGLYQVIEVTNSWKENVFTQKLKTIRRRNQPEDTGVSPIDISIESVIEKGLEAIISPLVSSPVAAFAGALDDIQGQIDQLGSTLSQGLGGAVANGVAALDAAASDAIGNISSSISGAAPNIPAAPIDGGIPVGTTTGGPSLLRQSQDISSRITDVDQAGRIRGGL